MRGLRMAAGAAALVGLAALLTWLPLDLAVLLSAGAAALVLLLWRPWLIWLPLAALLPFTSSVKFGRASATDLLFAAALALWFLDGVRRRTLPIRWSPVGVMALLFVGIMSLSALAARDFGEALAEVVKWAELPVLLVVVPAMLNPGRVRWVAAAAVAGGCAQALLGLYQFGFGVGPESFAVLDRFVRAYGTFAQPNPFGGYLGLILPVALSLALEHWTVFLGGAGRRRGALAWATAYTLATGVLAAGILASWSRGAWLGAAVGVLVVVVLRSRRGAVVAGVAVLGLAIAALLGSLSPEAVPEPVMARVQDIPTYFGLTDILAQPVTDENFAVAERMAYWVAAQRMWEVSPWLGVGPGNFGVVYPEVRLPRWEEPQGHAHNVYLNVLGEMGLAGLAAYVLLWAVTVVWVWRRVRQAQRTGTAAGRWYAALGIGVLGVVAHLSVHNLVDSLYVQGMVLLLGLWLALLHVEELPVSGLFRNHLENPIERAAIPAVE